MIIITTDDREHVLAAARRWGLTLFVGILFLVLGFIVLGYDDRSLTVLSIFIGVTFIMTGLSWFVIAGMVDELKAFWIIAGLLAVGAGIAALAWPDETVKLLSLFLGWFLLLAGLVQLLVSVTSRDREGWWLGVVVGIVLFGLGAWAVGETDRSVTLLTTLVGVYCLIKGVYDVIVALQLRRLKRELQRGAY